MLVDVELQHENDARFKDQKPNRLQKGVYTNTAWNFELLFRGRQDHALDYPNFGPDFFCFGVCDSPEQLVELLPDEVKDGTSEYVVSMVHLRKTDCDAQGGWRWHKWGPYIGKQEPQCEYLADEPVIEEVWTYHIYRVGHERAGKVK